MPFSHVLQVHYSVTATLLYGLMFYHNNTCKVYAHGREETNIQTYADNVTPSEACYRTDPLHQ